MFKYCNEHSAAAVLQSQASVHRISLRCICATTVADGMHTRPQRRRQAGIPFACATSLQHVVTASCPRSVAAGLCSSSARICTAAGQQCGPAALRHAHRAEDNRSKQCVQGGAGRGLGIAAAGGGWACRRGRLPTSVRCLLAALPLHVFTTHLWNGAMQRACIPAAQARGLLNEGSYMTFAAPTPVPSQLPLCSALADGPVQVQRCWPARHTVTVMSCLHTSLPTLQHMRSWTSSSTLLPTQADSRLSLCCLLTLAWPHTSLLCCAAHALMDQFKYSDVDLMTHLLNVECLEGAFDT